MLGGLLRTRIEARVRREALLAEAASERRRIAAYLDALDPAARLVERLVSAVRFVLARPVIPVALLATLVALKPRRALRLAVWALRAFSWAKRIIGGLG